MEEYVMRKKQRMEWICGMKRVWFPTKAVPLQRNDQETQ